MTPQVGTCSWSKLPFFTSELCSAHLSPTRSPHYYIKYHYCTPCLPVPVVLVTGHMRRTTNKRQWYQYFCKTTSTCTQVQVLVQVPKCGHLQYSRVHPHQHALAASCCKYSVANKYKYCSDKTSGAITRCCTKTTVGTGKWLGAKILECSCSYYVFLLTKFF